MNAATQQQIAIWMLQASEHGYIMRVLVALDIFSNVLTGGKQNETISSRVRRISDLYVGKVGHPGIWLARLLNYLLNDLQGDHGKRAQAGDLWRSQAEVDRLRGYLGLKPVDFTL